MLNLIRILWKVGATVLGIVAFVQVVQAMDNLVQAQDTYTQEMSGLRRCMTQPPTGRDCINAAKEANLRVYRANNDAVEASARLAAKFR